MRDLLETEPTQPDPDRNGTIPYFEAPADEPHPDESATNDNA